MEIRTAAPSDLDRLMPLRRDYEIEEVLLDSSSFSEASCRNRFRTTIQQKAVFIGEIEEQPVATCCINSTGIDWLQIGGVYTMPAYRARGISARLMSKLAEDAAYRKKDLTLFVKKTTCRL